MRKILVLCMGALLIGTAAPARDYAIIKDTMFGSQKIEVYKSLKDALDNYTGEGRIYEITLKPVPLRRVERKKTVEVSEYTWSVDEKDEKPRKEPPAQKEKNPQKEASSKK
ncbi:MAG TPA: hypothetical protein PLR71_11320 [Deltaproteobacteria bacterium]|nr:hypothetical protein [Deltaproteobacteria bacterium]HQI82133.1 hypothetical protein [Deltaproteobacteria bacterium]